MILDVMFGFLVAICYHLNFLSYCHFNWELSEILESCLCYCSSRCKDPPHSLGDASQMHSKGHPFFRLKQKRVMMRAIDHGNSWTGDFTKYLYTSVFPRFFMIGLQLGSLPFSSSSTKCFASEVVAMWVPPPQR